MNDICDIDKLCQEIYNATKRNIGDMEEGKIYDLKDIRELVEPLINLINEAKSKKKYIFIKPINKWLQPEILEKSLKNGYYVYHISSMEMKSPLEKIKELQNDIFDKQKVLKEFTREVEKYINGD